MSTEAITQLVAERERDNLIRRICIKGDRTTWWIALGELEYIAEMIEDGREVPAEVIFHVCHNKPYIDVMNNYDGQDVAKIIVREYNALFL